jgi:hypothetical protein
MPRRVWKRVVARSRNPLLQAVILQRVLDYVGPGRWCFVAEVNSMWADTYKKVATKEVHCVDSWQTTRSRKTTTLSAVLASPSRARHAHERKCHCTSPCYQRAAGRYADVATLEAAHELGMPYTYAALEEAACCNQLAVVQFLRAQNCHH